MSEELTIEREFIEQAKAEMLKNPKLQPCALCMNFDPEKQWCEKYQQTKHAYNYGSNCFITNEVALRALLLQEKKRNEERKAKLNEKMDVMGSMINGADLIREDILEMLESDYKRLDIKGKGDDEAYRQSKRNLDRLRKCYAKMKYAMSLFSEEYKKYIEYWHAQMFEDEDGVYSPEYDKYISNAGFVTFFFFCLHDKMFMNKENVDRLVKVINEMEGRDILDENDLKRYLIQI